MKLFADNPFRLKSALQDSVLYSEALRVAKAIAELPLRYPKQKPRAWLVGGFARDMLLGIPSKDIDIEVFGVSAEDLEALLETLYPNKVHVVGKAFGTLKVFLSPAGDLDISLPRRESKIGSGHRGFEVKSDPLLTPEEAARRRDFTINAISFDPLAQKWLDPFKGKQDLEKRLLRIVDETTFTEDPLRVYRGIQFAARFELSLEKKTFSLMKKLVEEQALRELSPERVTEELRKLLLQAKRPSIGFELMRELGIISNTYPELALLQRTKQEPEWHPEGDVWIHTMMVIDAAANIIHDPERDFSEKECLQIMLGALCHDLGKPSTTKPGEKHGVPRIRSLGHEAAGEEPTRTLLATWRFGDDVLAGALLGTLRHLQPGMIWFALERGQLTEEQYVNAVRKLVKNAFPVSWRVLLAIAEADFRGRLLPEATEPYLAGEKFAKTVAQYHFGAAPKKPLVQGQDLLELGLKPGPHFSELIATVEEARDHGEITTRAEGLAFVKKHLKKF
ncbi:hypothetical protein COX00_00480 [Candidatus Uhrbacteria bacterium CG22_combo_CG10-13_8_21_14_all_47_17]|uniref:HD domain-containing protein n=1 Tax=Candidatus Uhrbacteria bacterium CG22_combo_CG10-13_8_21_14_all_47_17 TaxID=1975041 RepID=A0A2H0BTF6_9BACT|nr:MAG: hypothetical protein COX00_00480 [Candidatus Uhrbacteria bacterium CG22_combo_CG10-13_8_21_14_all_47_17]